MTNANRRSPTIREESRMKTTASDVLSDDIHDWGVDMVFGLPGDGINGIMEALRKRADKIRFIQVRHEEAAAFMACVFFFQAEDGIRYLTVTGVQTCALPI